MWVFEPDELDFKSWLIIWLLLAQVLAFLKFFFFLHWTKQYIPCMVSLSIKWDNEIKYTIECPISIRWPQFLMLQYHISPFPVTHGEINKITLEFYNSKIKNFIFLFKIDANSYEKNSIASYMLVLKRNKLS